ncbi:MAG: hypothetical protein CMK59_00265 [Proteobacteria bacterium]|nr:hypothetical protein [Pseudomonadota bacterium]
MLNFSVLSFLLACNDTEDEEKDTGSTISSDTVDDDGDGFSEADGDCDDSNSEVYPGAQIIYDDGVDQDCSGEDEECQYEMCYEECLEPYDSENTFPIDPDVFQAYLDENGLLSEAQCEQLCFYAVQNFEWTSAVQVYECSEEGIDDDGNHLLFCSTQNVPYCEGRLHEGARPTGAKSTTPIGAWFARAAQAEATSVQSFLMLSKQLERLGAPKDLQKACVRAAGDEIKHAREMLEEALRYGADVPELSFGPWKSKSALELALENVVEGCVREGFAALQALHQSLNAKDAVLRAKMARIARDEARHVELAFRIDTWLRGQLSNEEGLLVENAKQAALLELEAYLREEPLNQCASELGLIDRSKALKMFSRFANACA